MRSLSLPSGHSHQGGFALMGYVFWVLTVVAALAVCLSLSLGNTGNFGTKIEADQIYSQAVSLRNRIINCALTYPGGNNGTGYHLAYPGASSATQLSGLTCPGQAGQPNLWNGSDGFYLPVDPAGSNGWFYLNTASDVRLQIQVSNNPTYLAALTAIAARFNAAEGFLTTTTVANDTFVLRITN